MRFYSVRIGLGVLSTLGLLGSGQHAVAQSNINTSIVGTIRDASGATIAGAQVVFKNLGNDSTQTVSSDPSGQYSLHNMVPGSYEITAAKYGFNDARARVVLDGRRPWRAESARPAGSRRVRWGILVEYGERRQQAQATEDRTVTTAYAKLTIGYFPPWLQAFGKPEV